jgi:hypothetical protein
MIPLRFASKFWNEVGSVGGTNFGIGVGVGVDVGVDDGVGVGVGVGFLTVTPLFQTNFFPDLIHV